MEVEYESENHAHVQNSLKKLQQKYLQTEEKPQLALEERKPSTKASASSV